MPWFKKAAEVDETAFDHLEEAIANDPENFRFLTGIRVAIVFRETNPRQKGREAAAKIKVASSLEQCLTGDDVIIVVGLPAWMRYDDRQRTALMDHELRHLAETDKGALTTIGHDLECFTENVRLYGRWNDGLAKEIAQLALPTLLQEDTG